MAQDKDLGTVVAIILAILGGIAVGVLIMKARQQGQQAMNLIAPQAGFTLAAAPIMTNKEEIEWTDRKGRVRKITIHREVH